LSVLLHNELLCLEQFLPFSGRAVSSYSGQQLQFSPLGSAHGHSVWNFLQPGSSKRMIDTFVDYLLCPDFL